MDLISCAHLKRHGHIQYLRYTLVIFILFCSCWNLMTCMYFTEAEIYWQPEPIKGIKEKNCKRIFLIPSWFAQTQSWKTVRMFECSVSENESQSLSFLDPVSCLMSSTTFAGETNIRDGGKSDTSGSSNRLRQLSLGVVDAAAMITNTKIKRFCLSEVCIQYRFTLCPSSRVGRA